MLILGITGTFEGVAEDTSYLYNAGTISSICGSFNSYNYEYYNTTVTLTNASSYLDIKLNNGTSGEGYGCWYNTKSVLMTNHNYLNMKFKIVSCAASNNSDCDFYGYLLKSSSPVQYSTNIAYEYIDLKSTSGTVTAVINISSVTGYYYFGFTLDCEGGGTTEIQMQQIWLSKS